MRKANEINILIACEESQAVCIEFRKLGFNAFSCDLLPCSGGHPEWHLQQDVTELLKQKWDALIAFPPCTDLAVSGAAWFAKKRESGQQEAAIEFFMNFINTKCDNVMVENPVNIISGKYIPKHFPELNNKYGFPIKPSQIIEPYYFGDKANKKTCLWIKGFPLLQHDPLNYVEGSKYITSPSGKRYPEWCWNTGSGCGGVRSKTFPGIAKAIADQYGKFLLEEINMKTTTEPLFSNGTEMMWFQDRNCSKCVKASTYNPKTEEYTAFRCTIDRDIQSQAAGLYEVNQQSYDICHAGICPKIQTEYKKVFKKREIKNQLQLEL